MVELVTNCPHGENFALDPKTNFENLKVNYDAIGEKRKLVAIIKFTNCSCKQLMYEKSSSSSRYIKNLF